MNTNKTRIVIQGTPDSGKSLIANVVNNALGNAGFKNVNMVNVNGEKLEPAQLTSIFDLVAVSNPGMFLKPIEIEKVTIPFEEQLDILNDTDLKKAMDENNINITMSVTEG